MNWQWVLLAFLMLIGYALVWEMWQIEKEETDES